MKVFEINGTRVVSADRAAEHLNNIGVPLHRADSTCQRMSQDDETILKDRDGRFLAHVRRLKPSDILRLGDWVTIEFPHHVARATVTDEDPEILRIERDGTVVAFAWTTRDHDRMSGRFVVRFSAQHQC